MRPRTRIADIPLTVEVASSGPETHDDLPVYLYVAHHWYCVGGAGGWEVWECRRCHRDTIPTIFGTLLPDALRHIPGLRSRFGCPIRLTTYATVRFDEAQHRRRTDP